jgi:hypothetical protein
MDRPVKLELALKTWLDHVLIPALVESYISATREAVHAASGTEQGPILHAVMSEAGDANEPSMRSVRPLFK